MRIFFALLSVQLEERHVLRNTWLSAFQHTPELDYRFFVNAADFNPAEQAGFGDLVALQTERPDLVCALVRLLL